MTCLMIQFILNVRMYEFFFGFAFGALTSRYMKRPKSDAQVQADELIIRSSESAPIQIPKKRKSFVPGELANFWSGS